MTDIFLDPLIFRETLMVYVYPGPPIFANRNIPFEKPCYLPMENDILAYSLQSPKNGNASSSSAPSAPSAQASSGKPLDFVWGLRFLIHVTTATAVAPLARVKLLLQCQDEMIKSGRLSSHYKGFTDCLTRTVKKEGVLSLWRGNSAYLTRIAVGAPLLKYQYDNFRVHVNQGYDFNQLSLESMAFHGLTYSTVAVISYPFDYVRTRLATDVKITREFGLSLDSARRLGSYNIANDANGRQFSGMFSVWKSTLKSDGLRGIFRGFTISCVGGLLAHELSMRTRNTIKEMRKEKKLWNALQLYILAEAVPLVLYPFETVSRRMMLTSGSTSKYKGALDAFHHIVKREGFSSLYKGAGTFIVHRHVYAILVHVFTNSVIIGLQKLEKHIEKNSRR